MKSNVKNNLTLGLGLSLALLFLSSLASYISIKNLIRSSSLVKESNVIIVELQEVLSLVKDAEIGQRGFMITGDEIFLEPYLNAKSKTNAVINQLAAQTTGNTFQQDNIARLRTDVDRRLKILDQNLSDKRNNITLNVDQFVAGKIAMDDIRSTLESMGNEERRMLNERTDKLNELAGITPVIIIITGILAIGITLFFFRKVLSDFNQKISLQKELQQKNDDIQARITAIENVASQISQGNYRIRLDQITKDGLGSLSVSLNKMAQSLQQSFDTLEEKEWLQAGIANLNEQMVGEKEIPVLVNDILVNVANFTECQVATVYVMGDDQLLHLEGSYAADQNLLKPVLHPGEGISGQCFQSGNPIILKGIHGDEMSITYATGKARPASIMAVNIVRDRVPIGVLEVASLNEFSPMQIEYLNNISESIGIAINTAQNRKKLQELLEETQAQSEELQTQHSELESMNAELEAQAQKLQASEEELRVQQEELMQSNQELEERTSLLEEKNELVQERNNEIQRKSKELELSSKYKSEFLANMSHELRTPLNSILLLSKLMLEAEDLDKEYIEYSGVIQSSGQGLLSLIDEILDLTKIESGKMQLEPEDIQLEEVITDMRSLFTPLIKEKKLDFKITTHNTPGVLHTDKMRLEQVLKNLLSNAIKFTAEGEIRLHITGNDAGNQLWFSVKDTGIGIAKDKQSLVFEAFQQADGSTRRRFGGTGLGLSISKELAKLLGGDIVLHSEENQGSEFVLRIPVNVSTPVALLPEPIEEVPEKEPEAKEAPHGLFVVDHIPNEIQDDRNDIKVDDKVILIVEDDTSFAKILLEYTRRKKYKGLVAVRGDQGLEMAQHFIPTAILLDIQLPVMDGWQVMEALKSDSKTRAIPVHIMSSLKMRKESLLSGAVDFINKPFALEQMQQVFQKLEHALSRHPKKVLIVEENEQHAKALSYFLSSYNINTQIVNNVNTGIRILQGQEVDCVILDMGVPDKVAFETLETIKQNKGLENLPVIVFTGKNLSIGEETRIKKYADSIVVKTAHSYQRILDEAGLFLHLVEEKNKKGLEAVPAKATTSELKNVLKNKTVLIADDDVRNIFSLTKALELHHMKVLAATDGREALKVVYEEKNIDVILMDMMMPQMDGYETIRQIRAINQFKKTPILAVTAKAMKGDREKCIAAGASDYISKPVDLDQLVSLLRVWLYENI